MDIRVASPGRARGSSCAIDAGGVLLIEFDTGRRKDVADLSSARSRKAIRPRVASNEELLPPQCQTHLGVRARVVHARDKEALERVGFWVRSIQQKASATGDIKTAL